VGAILLLTPVALAIAFGGSCAAVVAYVDATLPYVGEESSEAFWAYIISAWAVFLLPPVFTLAGMIWWALCVHRRNKRNGSVE
jgi:hypothetical protein